MQAGVVDVLTSKGMPVYVDAVTGSTIDGWQPKDPSNPGDPSNAKGPWTPALGNLFADPDFVMGYYLSQIAAGQKVDSPAVNASDVNANDPQRGFDPQICIPRGPTASATTACSIWATTTPRPPAAR